MRELIIDSFAGGGGASTGIELALGRSPDIAINHDAEALALHRMNHPETMHLPHNVWKIDPVALTAGRPVGLLWASPDCKHFSKAKGGKPVKRNIRDLAWVVVRWARQVRPRVIMLENVEEFRDWGPISADGVPCKERKGQEFKRWCGDLKRLGYKLEHRELRACDYGAPTIRKRLFVIARRDGEKIIWPAPTHGRSDDPDVVAGRKKPWRTAAEIIDWSLPCHSIFLNREEGRAVGVNRPLADATMARIAKGVKRYVLDAAKPFVVTMGSMGSSGESNPGSPVSDRTYAQQGGLNRSPEEPHSTICASTKDQNALIAPYLVPRYGERPGQEPRTRSVEQPAPVIVPTANGGSLAAVHLSRQFGASIGSDTDEPVGTVTAGGGGKTALVAAFMAQHNEGPRPGAPGRVLDEPVSTVTATGAQQALVEASFLTHHYTSNTRGGAGNPLDPLKTITAGGWHAAEVRAFLMKYYGPAIGQDAQDPLHTATAKARFGLVSVEIGGEPYIIADIGMRMLSPRELYRAQGFPDSYIIDRGLKVEVREGWGDDDGPAEVIPITKTAQVRMCGNSVCPPLAQALVAANYQPREAERAAPGSMPLFMEAAE